MRTLTNMVEVEIRQPRPSGDSRRGWETIARLTASGDRHEVSGDERAIDFTLPVPDGRAARRGGPRGQIRFADDREEWARNLPAVYRGPQLVAVVVKDTNPLPDPTAAGRAGATDRHGVGV